MKPQLCSPLGRMLVLTFGLFAALSSPFRAHAAACSSSNIDPGPGHPVAFVVAATSPGAVSEIDLTNNFIVCSIAVGNNPSHMAVTPDSSLLLVENDGPGTGDPSVWVISLADPTVITKLPLSSLFPPAPAVTAITGNIAATFDGTNLFAYVVAYPNPLPATPAPVLGRITLGAFSGGSIILSSPPTLTSIGSVTVNGATPLNGDVGVAFTPDGSLAYITFDGNTDQYKTATDAFNTSQSVTGGSFTVSPVGDLGWLVQTAATSSSAAPRRITIATDIFTATGAVAGQNVCSQSNTVTTSLDGTVAYYTCPANNSFQLIDTSTTSTTANKVTNTVNLGTAGSTPNGIAATTDGTSVLVANGNTTFSVFTSATPITPTTTLTETNSAGPGGALMSIGQRPPTLSGLAPSNSSVATGATQQFSVVLSHAVNASSLTWAVTCTQGGLACGTIDSTGKYTAPNAIPTGGNVTVSVTSPELASHSNVYSVLYPLKTTVTITPSQLAFTTQPTSVAAGSAITPAVQVSIEDAGGNVDTSSTAAVTIAIGTNPAGGTLSGTVTVNAVAGVATFSNLSLDKVGTGYTLTASSGVLTAATSAAFNVTPGPPAKLAFTAQPTNVVAGTAIAPAVQVSVLDSFGNLASTATNSVTVAIGTNPGGGTLSGTMTVSAVAGVATFSTLSIDKIGTGYTLTANSGALAPATSAAFNVTAGAPAKLVFKVQPTNVAAGAAITPAVQVSIQDAQGNIVPTATNAVTIAIGTNPSGGTLSGTTTVAAVAGVATFSTLSINKVGTGYTLGATSGVLTAATSTAFNVSPGAPAKLVFQVQPTNVVAGTAVAPAVQVIIQDAQGNLVNTATNAVTMAIGTNPGGGILSGAAPVNAVAGVATFSALSINKTGTGYTLTASSGALTAATSAAFNVTPGNPATLAFTVQPTSVTAGVAITPAVQVSVEDALGNLVPTATNPVAIAIGTNPGGGTLSGTTALNAVAGIATFSTLSINKTGIGYTLAATSAGLTAAASAAFNVNPGTAAQLVFTTQPPANGIAGSPLTASVISVEDALGNVVTSSTASIAITSAPTNNVGGTTTVSAVSGKATFSNLIFTTVGTYTLTGASAGLTGATSGSVTITPGPAAKLVFTTQPPATSALGGNVAPLAPTAATVEDAFGNVVTTSTAAVVISSTPANVSGTTTVAATAGVSTFSALTFTVAGNYTLTASSGALTPATSSGFTLTSTITGAITSTFTSVTIEDASDTFVGKANGDPNVPSLGVTWKMISCGGSSTTLGPCGTLASNGTYTPPNKVPAAPGNVFVAQATAVADPSKTVLTGNISVTSSITVAASVPLAGQTLPLGFTTVPAAVVSNDPNNPTLGATLNLTGCTAGGTAISVALCGSFNGSLYTAPSTYPASSAATPVIVTFTATSVADASKTGTASLTLVANTLSLASPSANLLIPLTSTSASVTLNLDGLNTANAAGVTFSGVCTNFGQLTGTCSFSPVTPGAPGIPSTLTMTLTVTRASAALSLPAMPYSGNRPVGRFPTLVLMLPLLAIAAATFRRTGLSLPKLRLSASLLILLCICVLWVSACNQFSTPAFPTSPQPPTLASSGNLTVTLTPSSPVFQTVQVSVPYTVQ